MDKLAGPLGLAQMGRYIRMTGTNKINIKNMLELKKKREAAAAAIRRYRSLTRRSG